MMKYKMYMVCWLKNGIVDRVIKTTLSKVVAELRFCDEASKRGFLPAIADYCVESGNFPYILEGMDGEVLQLMEWEEYI
jgi:hypothetical protein